MHRNQLLHLLIIGMFTWIFWFHKLDQLPLDYCEYGESNQMAYCIAESWRSKDSAAELYRKSYQLIPEDSEKFKPRVPFSEISIGFPIETFIRALGYHFFPSGDHFLTYKRVNGLIALIGFVLLYFGFLKILSPNAALLGTLLFISSCSLISVGRVSGRMSCFLSPIFISLTMVHLTAYQRQMGWKNLLGAGIWCGICFLNGLHSSVFILPSLAAWMFVELIFKLRLSPLQTLLKYLQSLTLLVAKALGIAILINACLATVLIYFLGYQWNETFKNFFLVNSYSNMVIHQRVGLPIDVLTQMRQQLTWYLHSFYFGNYFHNDPGNLEEYNQDWAFFSPIVSALLVFAIFRVGIAWYQKDASMPKWIPWVLSSVALHLFVILSQSTSMPVRYSLSLLPSYLLLTVFALQQLHLVLQKGADLRKLATYLLGLIALGIFVLSYCQLYTGSYFSSGGNTLIRRRTPWCGATQIASQIKHANPELDLNRCTFVYDTYINPTILRFELHGTPNSRFVYKSNILDSQKNFSVFCKATSRVSDHLFFIFNHLAVPHPNTEYQKFEMGFSASAEPVDAMQLLMHAPPVYIRTAYNDPDSTSFTCYRIKLSETGHEPLFVPSDSSSSNAKTSSNSTLAPMRFKEERKPDDPFDIQHVWHGNETCSNGEWLVRYTIQPNQHPPRFISFKLRAKNSTQILVHYDYGMGESVRKLNIEPDGVDHDYLIDLYDASPPKVKTQGLTDITVSKVIFYAPIYKPFIELKP